MVTSTNGPERNGKGRERAPDKHRRRGGSRHRWGQGEGLRARDHGPEPGRTEVKAVMQEAEDQFGRRAQHTLSTTGSERV